MHVIDIINKQKKISMDSLALTLNQLQYKAPITVRLKIKFTMHIIKAYLFYISLIYCQPIPNALSKLTP